MQTAHYACCLQSSKHLTQRQFSRLAGRIFYAAARGYGFKRAYLTGNRKGPSVQCEIASN